MRFRLVLLLSTLLGGNAFAQQPDSLTAAERQVQEIISANGLHVVHFWAPWCSNSLNELAGEWTTLVEANPEVSFTFVTIWNNGRSGEERMRRYNLPARVIELMQPDFGASNDLDQRRRSFLGLPVTWVPSTWIFHQNGELAFALNYGEMDRETLQHLLDVTNRDW